jgi:ribosomal protein S18 acetylase RimI-like enzyme
VFIPGSRVLNTQDAAALAALMMSAYRGTVDDEGETEVEALAEIEKTMKGGYGDWLQNYSLGTWIDESLVSAVVVTVFENLPLYAFCLTRDGDKRQGHCERLMRRSLGLLYGRQFPKAHLFVTASNQPAGKLYRKLGFTPDPQGG